MDSSLRSHGQQHSSAIIDSIISPCSHLSILRPLWCCTNDVVIIITGYHHYYLHQYRTACILLTDCHFVSAWKSVGSGTESSILGWLKWGTYGDFYIGAQSYQTSFRCCLNHRKQVSGVDCSRGVSYRRLAEMTRHKLGRGKMSALQLTYSSIAACLLLLQSTAQAFVSTFSVTLTCPRWQNISCFEHV